MKALLWFPKVGDFHMIIEIEKILPTIHIPIKSESMLMCIDQTSDDTDRPKLEILIFEPLYPDRDNIIQYIYKSRQRV